MNPDVKPNMLRPRWRKVFSDLWADKTRTGLVVASIAVGVFAIGVILTTFVIMSTDIDQSYAAVDPPNIDVVTNPFDHDLVHAVEKLSGVREVEGRRMIEIRVRKNDESWQNLVLVGIPDTTVINHLIPIQGTQFPGDSEVAISQNLMHNTGYQIGDLIEIELPDGIKHNLRVVGLVTDQTTSKPDPSVNNNAYVTLKTLRSYGLDSVYDHLFVTVEGDGSNPESIARVAAEVKDQVKKSQGVVYRMDEKLSTKHPMTDPILAVLGVLGALGGLITVLSSSLIINTLNALLTQQLRQIGVMKLVGARSYQILGMYLTLILGYGLIALVLAVPLGAIGGYGFAWFIANLMGATLQGFRVIPVAVLAQVLIAILLPLAAGFFPVNNGAKTNIQQAISNYRPRSQKPKRKLFNHTGQWFGWVSRPILLSFRNTFRKPGRLLLTLFTLTVAGAVFIGVFNVRDSMRHMMTKMMEHFMGDVTVSFRQPYQVSKVQGVLKGIPGVKNVEGWGGAVGEVWDADDKVVTNLLIVAPPQDTKLLRPDFVAGRWLLPGEKNAIVVSDSIYDLYPNLKPGDALTVKIQGRPKEKWVVVGVFRFVDSLGDPLAYANFDFLADRLHYPDQAASYRITTDMHDAAYILNMTRRIDFVLSDRAFLVQDVQSGLLTQANAAQALNILVIFLLIMAILTAFVGSIGLTGTMSINVLERTREIGVMRTIGAVDGVVMQSVIIEALVIGLITWVLAIGLSFPISSFLLTIVGEAMMGSTLKLSFTPLGIGLWLAVVIALSVFASIIPARNAARLTINEVLAYE